MQSCNNIQLCYHCGLQCDSDLHQSDGHWFCCRGCQMAYGILSSAGLKEFYHLNMAPGGTLKDVKSVPSFAEFDNEQILCRVCDFQNDQYIDVTLFVPQIHCSSCVWLLENLYRLMPGIRKCRVDYFKKTLSLSYERKSISLRKIAETLATLGYAPECRSREDADVTEKKIRKSLYLKIGIAGFCFGNIMLLSFPEYLLKSGESLGDFGPVFAWLTLLLALPVLLFSASEYFSSAFRALKLRTINIEVPLAIGLGALFFRSSYDVLWEMRIGFFDSFAGLVFFLLMGRLFKEKTFETLNFERRYESYFPLSITKIAAGFEKIIPLSEVRVGDRLKLRNQEIVPADAVLKSSQALIDYSFVTGESVPHPLNEGDLVYAGARQIGASIEVEVIKTVSQSHLTRLWNESVFKESKKMRFTQISDVVGRAFTWATLAIAAVSGLYWMHFDSARVIPAVTSILLVACPCALALAFPFTFGTAMRLLGRRGVYLKNMEVLEMLSWVDTVVFDKTGTLTHAQQSEIQFIPAKGSLALSADESGLIRSIAGHSGHPLSVALFKNLPLSKSMAIDGFEEIPGEGIKAKAGCVEVMMGKAAFVTADLNLDASTETGVHVSINGVYRGYFKINPKCREGLSQVINYIQSRYRVYLLSGDNKSQRDEFIKDVGIKPENMFFEQSPKDKMDFVTEKMRLRHHVAMIGDGLNDAGALRQSDVGIAMVDDVNAFSPASDVIVSGKSFAALPALFWFSQKSLKVLYGTVALSLVYNVIGLGFAMSGKLSPFVSAVLMPISSISVMLFSTLMTRRYFAKLFELDSDFSLRLPNPSYA